MGKGEEKAKMNTHQQQENVLRHSFSPLGSDEDGENRLELQKVSLTLGRTCEKKKVLPGN